MRRLVLPLILLAAASAFADSEFRQGSDYVRISATPCANEKVRQHIAAGGGDPADFRAARAEYQGAPYAACWRPIFDQKMIQLVYEDGDAGIVPFGAMKPVPEA